MASARRTSATRTGAPATDTWIRRLGSKHAGFRYADRHGRGIRDKRALARIDALRVPPAWRDVHIAPSPRSAIQAWGFDARGRKQYRYNERAVERRDLRKYHRVRQLAKELPRIRRALHEDAQRAGRAASLDVDAVAATVLRLISETFCRIGGERYARENGTFGITTLRKSHVQLEDGVARFVYRGKGSIRQQQVVTDPALVKLVRRQLATPGARLFRYRVNGQWAVISARDVNDYLHRRLGRYSAKDFRTWGGTLRAATVLAELGPARTPTEAKRNVALAMRLVSSELGNTPTICRKSYVHPIVVARYLDDGETIPLPRARRSAANRGQAHSPEERALIAFLDRHFPERRRAVRDAG
ncbi:MAG: DNA topoisomerase IB, partial [Gemmatimonadaceae bacterium]